MTTALLQILAVGLPVALLERVPVLRLRPQPAFRRFWLTDSMYLVTGYAAGGALTLAYLGWALRSRERLLGWGVADIEGLPTWLGVVAALVAIDLGNYLAHYLLHRVDALWEFHKVHHSSRNLDWLATFRSHVVEQVLRRLVAPTLLIVAGFPLATVAAASGLFLVFAIWNHSNLAVSRLRFAEALFITPALHRLHHFPPTTHRNLGTVFSVWDRLRGTLVREAPGSPVVGEGVASALGVPGEVESYPQSWPQQLVEPFRRFAALQPGRYRLAGTSR